MWNAWTAACCTGRYLKLGNDAGSIELIDEVVARRSVAAERGFAGGDAGKPPRLVKCAAWVAFNLVSTDLHGSRRCARPTLAVRDVA